MSNANHFNKLRKDGPLPTSWKPSTEPPAKRGPGQPRKTSDSPQTVHKVLSSNTATANRLCLFPGSLTVVAFLDHIANVP